MLAQAQLATVGRPLLLPGGRALVNLADGGLAMIDTESLEVIGLLSSRDASAQFGPTVFDPPSHIWFDNGVRFERISVDPQRWAEQACQIAGRSLTEREWSRFVSSTRPYDPVC